MYGDEMWKKGRRRKDKRRKGRRVMMTMETSGAEKRRNN
jgi:hypothetical protein